MGIYHWYKSVGCPAEYLLVNILVVSKCKERNVCVFVIFFCLFVSSLLPPSFQMIRIDNVCNMYSKCEYLWLTPFIFTNDVFQRPQLDKCLPIRIMKNEIIYMKQLTNETIWAGKKNWMQHSRWHYHKELKTTIWNGTEHRECNDELEIFYNLHYNHGWDRDGEREKDGIHRLTLIVYIS